MTTGDATAPRFVVCVSNDGYPMDLALHRIYEVHPDASAERSGWIRIVDETGEDYLYAAKLFQQIEVSQALGKSCSVPPDSIAGEKSRVAPAARLFAFPATRRPPRRLKSRLRKRDVGLRRRFTRGQTECVGHGAVEAPLGRGAAGAGLMAVLAADSSAHGTGAP